MFRTSSIVLIAFLLCSNTPAAEKPGLVAHWDFNEGTGSILHDRSGNENHGKIAGAKWVPSGPGHALVFDGLDDYVDCGAGRSLDIRGPVSLSAWVRPVAASAKEPGIVGKYFESYALTLYRGGSWWYISSGGNNLKTPLTTGQWHHVAGTFDGREMRIYHNGVECARKESKFKSVKPGKRFLMGCIVADPDTTNLASPGFAHMTGSLDEVKVHSRAISLQEVITEFNRQAKSKGLAPLDTSWFGRFRLKPYRYPEKKRLVVDVDYLGLVPIAEGSKMFVELVGPNKPAPLDRRPITPNPDRPRTEITFSLAKPSVGGLQVRAVLERAGGQDRVDMVALAEPAPPSRLPAPEEKVVGPLAPKRPPADYGFFLKEGGGFVVRIKGNDYPVESSYSFPHGGENRLRAAAPDAGGEPAFRKGVRCRKLDDKHYRVAAAGKHYSIDRRITLHPGRIEVSDTITNTSPEVVGIILSNHVDTRGKALSSVELPKNFSLYLSAPDHGLAMVALDDVYQLQQDTFYRDHVAAITTDKFGLDRGALHTVKWALYPTASGDYYEFVNRFREVEGLNRTIEGAFGLVGRGEGLITAADRRTASSPREVQAKGMKYVSFFYLIAPADDPGMSLEGIEFTEYPKESALLKKAIAETHRLNPGIKVMFHIAHGLYATNQPEKLFPDSRAINSSGKQIIYGPDSASYYCRYFSRERFDQGHRWWIFYPTMENSFGKAMLRAIDYMLDEIGASAMYADGFVSGYAGGYTYDRWDGHSVEIDPKTKTVRRKKGNVTLMALPVLKAVARKVAAKGGVVITNGRAGPRSLWKEDYFTTCETSGGDQMPISRFYTGPTVTAFGDPQRIHCRRDLYLDILAKLDWGALYFYYGDKNFGVEERTLVPHMYPFTLEEVHRGWTRGKERIITRKPGVYGWHGDNHLHRVYLSDARGGLVANTHFSTADAAGVRTELPLGQLEAAVVEKIPVGIETDRPVNFLVQKYDKTGLAVLLCGKGKARLVLSDGKLPIQPGKTYLCGAGKPVPLKADAGGMLTVPVDLDALRRSPDLPMIVCDSNCKR